MTRLAAIACAVGASVLVGACGNSTRQDLADCRYEAEKALVSASQDVRTRLGGVELERLDLVMMCMDGRDYEGVPETAMARLRAINDPSTALYDESTWRKRSWWREKWRAIDRLLTKK